MKILRKKIDHHTGGGSVEVEAESVEDMWQVYNLIQIGDKVRGVTSRKVIQENTAGTATSSERVRVRLLVDVTSTQFDQDTGQIRCSGKNAEKNEYVQLGAHATLDLEERRPIDITKTLWDARSLELLKQLSVPGVGADLAVVLLEPGVAEVLYVTASLTLPRARVQVSVPKKRAGSDRNSAALDKFFDAATAAVARAVDFTAIKVVILASAGFLKDDFYKHMLAAASSKPELYKKISDHKDKFVLAHAPSGHRRDLVAVLSDPGLSARLSDTKLAGEVSVLSKFFDTLSTDPDRCHYGWAHCRVATDRGAVQTLLVSDNLYRSRRPGERGDVQQLGDDVKAAGGHVHVFSTQHPSGEQLAGMGGVAALLRYPLPEIDIEEPLKALRQAGADMPGGRAAAAAAAAAGATPSRPAGSGTPAGHRRGSTGPDEQVAEEPRLEYDSDGSSDSDASYKR